MSVAAEKTAKPKTFNKIVVIGASAGALDAFYGVLPGLPKDYALPVLIVMHVPPDKKSVIAELLAAKCALAVTEAEDKEPLAPGHVYIAPPDYHLLVESDGHISLSSDEQVLYSRPSIDVLFESAADAYDSSVIGVVLSGANHDGAAGLAKIVASGGRALVQRPDLAYAATMPQAAADACPTAEILTLAEITAALKTAGEK